MSVARFLAHSALAAARDQSHTAAAIATERAPSAEWHKAERAGRERPVREELRETVRRAVAGATSEEAFFDRLAPAGLLIRKRVAPSGDLLGYKVALPDDRNGEKEPVFYAGSTLAPDLSPPRIRERWALPEEAASAESSRPEQPALPDVTGPAFAQRRATVATWQARLARTGHISKTALPSGRPASTCWHLTQVR